MRSTSKVLISVLFKTKVCVWEVGDVWFGRSQRSLGGRPGKWAYEWDTSSPCNMEMSTQYTVYSVQFTVHSVQCTVYTVPSTVYSV